VRVNRADREALLKVPGLGPDTVKRILKMRQEQRITSIADLGKEAGKSGKLCDI